MPTATRAGVDLCYEIDGDDDGIPLLLVNGLGSQLTNWADELLAALRDRGFRLVRFDNRDAGLSTKFSSGGGRDVLAAIGAVLGGEDVDAPYLLADMAADAVAVLDAAGIERAHLLGVSMGGMIVQQVAIDHPERVRSLTSIMSTTGDPDVGQPRADVLPLLYEKGPTDRAGAIAHAVETDRLTGSPAHFDEQRSRAKHAAAYDRCFSPAGVGRQLLAILASGSRHEGLAQLEIPTLVVHGEVDPLVDVSGGRRTAETVPGAELLLVPGMGHDLPLPLLPPIVEAVTSLASGADAARAAR